MSRGTFILGTLAIMLTACAWAATVAHWEFAPDPARPGIIPDRSGNGHDLSVGGDPGRMRFETNEMFPITPVELHKGWILGEERLVTAVSGTFRWRQERRPDVLVFDLAGRPVPADADIARALSGWTVTLRMPDWQSIAVVR